MARVLFVRMSFAWNSHRVSAELLASPLLRRNDCEDWPGTYLIDEVSHELANYRQFALPNPHRQNSFLWSLLPFDIADEILFQYLALIDNFMYLCNDMQLHLSFFLKNAY